MWSKSWNDAEMNQQSYVTWTLHDQIQHPTAEHILRYILLYDCYKMIKSLMLSLLTRIAFLS